MRKFGFWFLALFPMLLAGLLVGDSIVSLLAETPFSFRFKSSPDISVKNAPTSVRLTCGDSSFYAGEIYCVSADVSGEGYYEQGVKWQVLGDSASFFTSANRLYFSSSAPETVEIKACSCLDENVFAAFAADFQEARKPNLSKTYKNATFFYSSGSDILSYVSSSSIHYDCPLKLNFLLQNPEHESAFLHPRFRFTSDCNSKVDDFGNVMLSPLDIGKTIMGVASLEMSSCETLAAEFSFEVLYPNDYLTRSFELYAGSFLLNSLPFALSSFCLSLLLKRREAFSMKTMILIFGIGGLLLIGLNSAACFFCNQANFMLVLVESLLSYLLGFAFPFLKDFLPRRKTHGRSE